MYVWMCSGNPMLLFTGMPVNSNDPMKEYVKIFVNKFFTYFLWNGESLGMLRKNRTLMR